jgi:hypothetical protein
LELEKSLVLVEKVFLPLILVLLLAMKLRTSNNAKIIIMKSKITIFLCIISFLSTAQEISKLNIGVDYLILKNYYSNRYGDFHYTPQIGGFVEKPFLFPLFKSVIFSPGLSFNTIHEKFHGGGLGAGSYKDLTHYSFSGYGKLIHQTHFRIFPRITFYFGGLIGTRLITWSKGNASNYSISYPEANWEDPDYTERPSHLYKKMYAGLLSGLEFKTHSFIHPSFEARFLPRYGQYKQNMLNPFEIALQIGLGTKNK